MQRTVKEPYTNRELSWLDFNMRVLEEAFEEGNPVLERVRFLGITASNLDEFFMVRVAGVRECMEVGDYRPDASGLTPERVFNRLSKKIRAFGQLQITCWQRLVPLLRQHGLELRQPSEWDAAQIEFVKEYFETVLFPVLTPLAVDRSRPFPVLASRSLNLGVRLEKNEKSAFAVVQLPTVFSRLVELPSAQGRAFALLENVIAAHLDALFETYCVEAVTTFRITRRADLDVEEDGEDLCVEIRRSLRRRLHGRLIRLELEADCDWELRDFLLDRLSADERDVYAADAPLDLRFCLPLSGLDDRLRLPPILPVPAADFAGCTDWFAAIRERDRFVHHPFESFDCVIEFLRQAAEDKAVLAVKQTLYRVSGKSPVVQALKRAAENGKQVTVLVELKARFDEENNLNWARELEKAGCHVVYGVEGLKTHCKLLLVVRQETDGLRRYVHMGTGNYNDVTARLYTDMGLFTCRGCYGADATELFNTLTGYSHPAQFHRLITAPDAMRNFFFCMIDAEIANALHKRPSGIFAKVNALVDPAIISRLYAASCAGVPVMLIVRGICCLVPGIRGVSERITVRSIVGQLLEHSRLFRFENAGQPCWYFGSADWMPRNLDRRVELVFPAEDVAVQQRLEEVKTLLCADTVNAREQQADGSYGIPDRRGMPTRNCHTQLAELARRRWKAQTP